ncbi:MAG: hypothetical protein CVU72_01035 [Deltaproteobacteria bacterium HGW-Deltaproteobacteria-7]|nr:MAG: hypothetical protein CVU72_01035 [Deltaproteobacteria bacterium HGW-Deltaproteobacteria-7]
METLLTKYGAKNIVRQILEGKTILTAELKVQNMKDLVARLKTIGRAEERSMPADHDDGNVSLVIEILNK